MATTTVNLGLSLDGLSNVDTTGKNDGDILTWNATSGKWEDAASSGGGTPAGTSGQVQFNDAGSFGADSAFHWDNTNKRLGVGATPSSTVRLDVRAQGALSTDIAFRVRDSADTQNLLQIQGNGESKFFAQNTMSNQYGLGVYNNAGTLLSGYNNYGYWRVNDQSNTKRNVIIGPRGGLVNALDFNALAGDFTTVSFNGGLVSRINSSASFGMLMGYFSTSKLITLIYEGGNLSIGYTGDSVMSANQVGTKVVSLASGTAPSTSYTDAFKMYSADIVAGNAAPHFRTENGSIIKLYQQSSAGITTVADLVTILQNVGLLS